MKSLSTVKQIVAQLCGEFLLAKKIKLPQPEQTQVYQYLTGEPPPIFPHALVVDIASQFREHDEILCLQHVPHNSTTHKFFRSETWKSGMRHFLTPALAVFRGDQLDRHH